MSTKKSPFLHFLEDVLFMILGLAIWLVIISMALLACASVPEPKAVVSESHVYCACVVFCREGDLQQSRIEQPPMVFPEQVISQEKCLTVEEYSEGLCQSKELFCKE